ncbi:hypothetical protein BV20DRAFT_1047006 [Pilatotrama ljubarskyi]|nr:hypothetical protein BV20DRAFT_1047006 [Pilatotrama ljubarskyi]
MPASKRAPVLDDIVAEEMARAMERDASLYEVASSSASEHVPNSPDTLGPTITQLPQEILLYIFRATVPPAHQHDPSVIHGPSGAWMTGLRTRKALVTVCRTFFGPAMEVLYEDIVLRRMGQIPALARTLDPARTPSAKDVAVLIRSIRMDSCVVWTPFADVIKEDLQLIMRRCTALRAFSFHPHANFTHRVEPEDETYDAFNPAWLFTSNPKSALVSSGLLYSPLEHGLSTLDLVIDLLEEDDFMAFHALLASSPRLSKLKIKLTDLCANEPPDLGPTRQLQGLKDLYYHAPSQENWFLDYICHAWSLPQLQALTIIEPGELRVDLLLREHGANLTYLHWRNEHLDFEQSYAFDRLASYCPQLEHLVFQRYTTVLPVIRSPTLRFLDFWASYEAPPPQEVFLGATSPGSEMPRLERVRVLAGPPLHFALYPPTVDWPRICHPLGVDGQRHLIWRFPAMRVVQTSWGVFFEDAPFFYSHDLLNVVAPGPDMEPGGPYEEQEEEDGGEDRTSAASESDDSLEWDDGSGKDDDIATLLSGAPARPGGTAPVDRETMLQMVEDSLNRPSSPDA